MAHMAEPRYRAETVAQTIKAQGRSVTWLARQIGVSRGYTSDVVHGRYTVKRDFAERIAAALGMPFFLAFAVSDDTLVETGDEAA
jgi:plasmid maintenance system antidote protein VapI